MKLATMGGCSGVAAAIRGLLRRTGEALIGVGSGRAGWAGAEALEPRQHLAVNVWTGLDAVHPDEWARPNNWSLLAVPDLNDDVHIEGLFAPPTIYIKPTPEHGRFFNARSVHAEANLVIQGNAVLRTDGNVLSKVYFSGVEDTAHIELDNGTLGGFWEVRPSPGSGSGTIRVNPGNSGGLSDLKIRHTEIVVRSGTLSLGGTIKVEDLDPLLEGITLDDGNLNDIGPGCTIQFRDAVLEDVIIKPVGDPTFASVENPGRIHRFVPLAFDSFIEGLDIRDTKLGGTAPPSMNDRATIRFETMQNDSWAGRVGIKRIIANDTGTAQQHATSIRVDGVVNGLTIGVQGDPGSGLSLNELSAVTLDGSAWSGGLSVFGSSLVLGELDIEVGGPVEVKGNVSLLRAPTSSAAPMAGLATLAGSSVLLAQGATLSINGSEQGLQATFRLLAGQGIGYVAGDINGNGAFEVSGTIDSSDMGWAGTLSIDTYRFVGGVMDNGGRVIDAAALGVTGHLSLNGEIYGGTIRGGGRGLTVDRVRSPLMATVPGWDALPEALFASVRLEGAIDVLGTASTYNFFRSSSAVHAQVRLIGEHASMTVQGTQSYTDVDIEGLGGTLHVDGSLTLAGGGSIRGHGSVLAVPGGAADSVALLDLLCDAYTYSGSGIPAWTITTSLQISRRLGDMPGVDFSAGLVIGTEQQPVDSLVMLPESTWDMAPHFASVRARELRLFGGVHLRASAQPLTPEGDIDIVDVETGQAMYLPWRIDGRRVVITTPRFSQNSMTRLTLDEGAHVTFNAPVTVGTWNISLNDVVLEGASTVRIGGTFATFDLSDRIKPVNGTVIFTGRLQSNGWVTRLSDGPSGTWQSHWRFEQDLSNPNVGFFGGELQVDSSSPLRGWGRLTNYELRGDVVFEDGPAAIDSVLHGVDQTSGRVTLLGGRLEMMDASTVHLAAGIDWVSGTISGTGVWTLPMGSISTFGPASGAQTLCDLQLPLENLGQITITRTNLSATPAMINRNLVQMRDLSSADLLNLAQVVVLPASSAIVRGTGHTGTFVVDDSSWLSLVGGGEVLVPGSSVTGGGLYLSRADVLGDVVFRGDLDVLRLDIAMIIAGPLEGSMTFTRPVAVGGAIPSGYALSIWMTGPELVHFDAGAAVDGDVLIDGERHDAHTKRIDGGTGVAVGGQLVVKTGSLDGAWSAISATFGDGSTGNLGEADFNASTWVEPTIIGLHGPLTASLVRIRGVHLEVDHPQTWAQLELRSATAARPGVPYYSPPIGVPGSTLITPPTEIVSDELTALRSGSGTWEMPVRVEVGHGLWLGGSIDAGIEVVVMPGGVFELGSIEGRHEIYRGSVLPGFSPVPIDRLLGGVVTVSGGGLPAELRWNSDHFDFDDSGHGRVNVDGLMTIGPRVTTTHQSSQIRALGRAGLIDVAGELRIRGSWIIPTVTTIETGGVLDVNGSVDIATTNYEFGFIGGELSVGTYVLAGSVNFGGPVSRIGAQTQVRLVGGNAAGLSGVTDNQGLLVIDGVSPLAPTFTNSGTLRISNLLVGAGTTIVNEASGRIEVQGGVVNLGPAQNSGAIWINSGATLVNGSSVIYLGGSVSGLGTFNIDSTQFVVQGTMVVSAPATLRGATITGPGHITFTGTVRLASTTFSALGGTRFDTDAEVTSENAAIFVTAALENAGTVLGTVYTTVYLDGAGSMLRNLPGGLIDAAAGMTVTTQSVAGSAENAGDWRFAGASNSSIAVPLVSSGSSRITVVGASRQLTISRGSMNTGTMTMDGDGLVIFMGLVPHVFDAPVPFGGTGRIDFDWPSTFTFQQNSTITNPSIMWSGLLTGTGTVTLEGVNTRASGGLVIASTLRVAPGAVFTRAGGSTDRVTGILEVAGTLTGSGGVMNLLINGSQSRVRVLSTGTINAPEGLAITTENQNTSGVLELAGRLVTGTVNSSVAVPLVSSGSSRITVVGASRQLTISRGSMNTGTMTVDGDGLVIFMGLVPHVFDAPVPFGGTGRIDFDWPSTFTFQQNSTITNPSIMWSGLLTGTGTVTLEGVNTRASGGLVIASTLRVAPGAVFTRAGGSSDRITGTLEVAGTLLSNGGTLNFLVNGASAALRILGGGEVLVAGGMSVGTDSTPGVFSNAGTLRVTGGSASINIPISNFNTTTRSLNGGTWDVASGAAITNPGLNNLGMQLFTGGTIVLRGAAPLMHGLSSLRANSGTLRYVGYTFNHSAGVTTFVNTGLIESVAGTTVWPATITLDNAGVVAANGGALTFSGPIVQRSGQVLTGGTWRASGANLTVAGAGVTAIGAAARVELAGPSSVFALVDAVQQVDGALVLTNRQMALGAVRIAPAGSLHLAEGSGVHLTGDLTLEGALTGTGSLSTVSAAGGSFAIGSALTGSLALTLTGGSALARGEIDITGSLFNGSDLDIGATTLHVGSFEQAAAGVLRLELASDVENGRVVAEGDVALDGGLIVTNPGGFDPSNPGLLLWEASLLTGSQISGEFSDLQLPSCVAGSLFCRVEGGAYKVLHNYADFNADGGVDFADIERMFQVWEAGDGSSDVNGDGGIDFADLELFFALWEAGGR